MEIHFIYHSSVDGHLDYFWMAVINNSGLNIHVQVFVATYFLFSWVYTKKWNYWVTWQLGLTIFQGSYIISHSHQQCVRVLISPHSHQHLLLTVFFSIVILVGVKWYFIVVLFEFPWWLLLLTIFSYAYQLFVHPLWRTLYSDLLSTFELGYLSFLLL